MPDDFENELKAGFLEEATQLLSDAEQCFLSLESNPEDPAITDKLFRLAHNLKGSGNAVGFSELGHFTHKLESFLLKIKRKEANIDRVTVDLLLKCNDHLRTWIDGLKTNFDANPPSDELLAELDQQLTGVTPQPEVRIEAALPEGYPPAADFSDHNVPGETKHDEQTEPLVAENTTPHDASPVTDIAPRVLAKKPSAAKPVEDSIRVGLDKLEKLLNFVGELVILQSVLREQIQTNQIAGLKKTSHQLRKVTKEVQDISMSLRMIPVKQMFQKMQRIVRDTSAVLDKKVNLILEGEATEVDKTVLEELGDPLVHMIRNAVDHGIEPTEVRVAAGKNPIGQVTLKAYHQSGNLMIEISDDGGGLNPEVLKTKAIEKGILKTTNALSDRDALKLIFAPGFSTKAVVTDVSGRGVGMDVVKTNIDALEGDIQIESKLGLGTTFKIKLPLTMAIIDGMIIKSNNERYVIPLAHVHETIKPAAKDLHFVTGMGNVFTLRGENLPLYQLSQLLGKKVTEATPPYSTAIVVRGQRSAFAVLVDEIVSQTQVVIKQLGDECKGLNGFSGSAILGDGRPALILELEDLNTRMTSKKHTERKVA